MGPVFVSAAAHHHAPHARARPHAERIHATL